MRRFGSIASGLAAATLAVFVSGCADYGPYAGSYYGNGPYDSYWPYSAASSYGWYGGPRYPERVYRDRLRGHDGHSAAWWAEHRRVQRAERAEHRRVMRQRAQNRRAERRQEERAERRRAERRRDHGTWWPGQYDSFQGSREWQPGEPRYARGRQ